MVALPRLVDRAGVRELLSRLDIPAFNAKSEL